MSAQDTSIHDAHIGDATTPTPETVNNVQERRRRLLIDGCRQFGHIVNKSRPDRFELYYDDEMGYIYCLVSKASCTSWKGTLMMLTGNITKYQSAEQLPRGMVHDFRNSDKYVKRLGELPQAHRDRRFNSYFTFLFVREPLERLVSAYHDKLFEDPGYHVDVDIVRQYRPHDYNASIKRYNVTFAEFVRYVLDQRDAGRALDRHWIPQSELCRVCKYRYDFIGHQETLQQDASFVVSKLKSRISNEQQRQRVANVTFPADSGHRKSRDLVERMYAGVPAAHVQALYELYASDYAIFGFKHPNVTQFA